MIWERSPWRDQLVKDAEIIDRWAAKNEITERRSFLIEYKVFVAAYIVRKLWEARKLSSSFDTKCLNCKVFPTIGNRRANSGNSHHIHKLYDLSSPETRPVDARQLLNLIIHSLIFSEVIRRNRSICGLYVTTKRLRKNLWYVKLKSITYLMRYVASDSPASVHKIFDAEQDDWIEWRGKGKPSQDIVLKMAKAKATWSKSSQ